MPTAISDKEDIMTMSHGTASKWMRKAGLSAAAVIGVTACAAPPSASRSAASPSGDGTMTNMAMPGSPPSSAPGASTSVPLTPQRGDVHVRIINFKFSPATVTVRAGQTVEWTNQDGVAHTVDLSGVTSNVLNRGDSYTQRFTAPGTYAYICSIHPFMHGTVVVTP
jgi:plastocyanin